jgi:hypothetical protein
LVGEVRNALALYIAAISSVLDRPINIIVKGVSSSGKNFLVSRVLRLLPKAAIKEISSSSKTAWNYAGTDFKNRIVYLQERNDAAGAVHPVRLLISENRLVRTVTVRKGSRLVVETFEAEGPIASISTTTRDRIEIDDETRHISAWLDETPEQTRRIIDREASPLPPLSDEEIEAWHKVYELISRRASVPIQNPRWLAKINSKIFVNNTSVRRYYRAFLSAVRTVALIRSFEWHPEDFEEEEGISLDFSDFAIAIYVFDDLLVESLSRGDDQCLETSKAIETIASTQDGKPVDADQLAKYFGISYDKAAARLRVTLQAGVITRTNISEKNNKKKYLPAKADRFIPDPKELIAELQPKRTIEFVHPVTGETLKFKWN